MSNSTRKTNPACANYLRVLCIFYTEVNNNELLAEHDGIIQRDYDTV